MTPQQEAEEAVAKELEFRYEKTDCIADNGIETHWLKLVPSETEPESGEEAEEISSNAEIELWEALVARELKLQAYERAVEKTRMEFKEAMAVFHNNLQDELEAIQ